MRFSRFKLRQNKKHIMLLTGMLLIGALGTYLLLSTHAATPQVAVEPESGTSKGAKPVPDTTASGNGSVKFRSDVPYPKQCNGDRSPVTPVTNYRIAICDDFNTGDPETAYRFRPYIGDDKTTAGVGRLKERCSIADGMLTQIQLEDGSTCGGQTSLKSRYGLWEVRMRSYFTGNTAGSAPHPVLLLWPDTYEWKDGEIDFFEADLGDKVNSFLHCTDGNPKPTCFVAHRAANFDYSQFHTYSLLWEEGPTQRMSMYIDGELWWTTVEPKVMPAVSMHLAIQLDNVNENKPKPPYPPELPVRPGRMDVDWMRMYKKL